MPLTFNPTHIKEGEYVPCTPGWHLAKVTNAAESTSSKGNPQWVLDFIIIDGPSDSKTLRDWMSLTEKALWRVKWFLSDAGFDMATDQEISIHAEDLVGRMVGIQVEMEPSNKTNPETGKAYMNPRIKSFCRQDVVADNIRQQIASGKGLAVPADSELPF